jgi:hypothetical protein
MKRQRMKEGDWQGEDEKKILSNKPARAMR